MESRYGVRHIYTAGQLGAVNYRALGTASAANVIIAITMDLDLGNAVGVDIFFVLHNRYRSSRTRSRSQAKSTSR